MYSSGNIDVRNWVHLFESRCTTTRKKNFKQVTAVSRVCYTGALVYGRLRVMSSTKVYVLTENLFVEVVSHV